MCVRCVGTVHLQRFAIKTKFLDQVELRKSALQMPKNISKTSQTMGKLIVPQHSTSFLQSVHWDPCKTKRKKTLQKHNNKWCNRALRTLDCILCDYDMLVYSHTLFLYTSTAYYIYYLYNVQILPQLVSWLSVEYSKAIFHEIFPDLHPSWKQETSFIELLKQKFLL